MFSAIVSVDNGWGIGKDNKLLFDCAEDKKLFRMLTSGHTVIMGKNTYLSLPNGYLENRENIVLSKSFFENPFPIQTPVIVEKDGSKLVNCFFDSSVEDFIIGGAKVYSQFLQYCNTVYVTKFLEYRESDAYFPNLDEDTDSWMKVKETEEIIDIDRITGRNVLSKFCIYKKRWGNHAIVPIM